MSQISEFLSIFSQRLKEGVDFSSLQYRLTLGIGLVTLVSIGGTVSWTIWKMQQMLITSHAENVEFVASYLPGEIARQNLAEPLEIRLKKAVNHLSSYNLLLWIKGNDSQLIAQSLAFEMSPERQSLIYISAMPIEPKLYRLHDRYLVVCSRNLQVGGHSIGWFYLAKDITHDYLTLVSLSETLQIAGLLTIALIIGTAGFLVWRSLHPLRQVKKMSVQRFDGLMTDRLDSSEMPSEVKALAETYNTLLDRLDETGNQHRRFANDVSHELRTPLSVVYGYLQSMLRRGSNLTVPQQEALEIAASETERTIQLLQSLLDLARTDGNLIPVHLEVLILNEVVAEVSQMTDKFNHHPIHIKAENEAVTVKADRDYLCQILIHLLDNAVNYSEPQQPITVLLSQESEWGVIKVCDRGCGIPLSEQAHIFDPLYRVDPSRCRTTGGNGLGLSIVKSLVESMGGRVTVQSAPGEGSTFVVTLPSP